MSLARGYAERKTSEVPTEAVAAHIGVHGPGWLAPVAIVGSDRHIRLAEVLELAEVTQAERSTVPALVAWVELAAGLWRGQGLQAVRSSGQRTNGNGQMALTGDTATDALLAGKWALGAAGPPVERVARVAMEATPGVTCSAAVLLGLHFGVSVWPIEWHKRAAADCGYLAARLLSAHRPSVALPRRVG